MQSDPNVLEYEGPYGNALATAAHFGHQDLMDELSKLEFQRKMELKYRFDEVFKDFDSNDPSV